MTSSDRIEELVRKFAQNPRRYFAALANEYRRRGEMGRAIEICRTHLAEHPAHLSGYVVLGQALSDSGRQTEAAEALRTALAFDPENYIALRLLGEISLESGDRAEAREYLTRALEIEPRNEQLLTAVAGLETPAAERRDEAPGVVPAEEPSRAAAETAPETEAGIPLLVSELEASPAAAEEERLALPAEDETPALAVGVESPAAAAEPESPVVWATEEAPSAVVEEETPATVVEEEEAPAAAVEEETPATVVEEEEAPAAAAEEETPVAVVEEEAAPAPLVTETMADLYLEQGHRAAAIDVLRQLVANRPDDQRLQARLDELQRSAAETIQGLFARFESRARAWVGAASHAATAASSDQAAARVGAVADSLAVFFGDRQPEASLVTDRALIATLTRVTEMEDPNEFARWVAEVHES